jgi:hypothetical protein
MEGRFVWEILQEVNVIWLGLTLISILFFFFFVKVKFQKSATLKAYGILFYAFVFYTISALSFVILNACDSFFRLSNDIYSSFLWFFPYTLLCSFMGVLIGWLIYFAGTKTAAPYVFKLMNLSLLVIAPTMVYTLLVQPFHQTIQMAFLPVPEKLKPGKDITLLQPEILDSVPSNNFIPATPAQLFDSLMVQVKSANQLMVMNPLNGFSFVHPIRIQTVEQIYILQNPRFKQVNILLNAPGIQGESEWLLIDSLGLLVYSQLNNNGLNRISLSEDGKYLKLQEQISLDSLSEGIGYRLRP